MVARTGSENLPPPRFLLFGSPHRASRPLPTSPRNCSQPCRGEKLRSSFSTQPGRAHTENPTPGPTRAVRCPLPAEIPSHFPPRPSLSLARSRRPTPARPSHGGTTPPEPAPPPRAAPQPSAARLRRPEPPPASSGGAQPHPRRSPATPTCIPAACEPVLAARRFWRRRSRRRRARPRRAPVLRRAGPSPTPSSATSSRDEGGQWRQDLIAFPFSVQGPDCVIFSVWPSSARTCNQTLSQLGSAHPMRATKHIN